MRRILGCFAPAQAWARKDLCGIRDPQRVEGAAQPLHGVQVRLGEHFGHHVLLLFPHSVLSGNRPAFCEAQLEDPLGKTDSRFHLPPDAMVVEHHAEQVAIARVQHVGYTYTRLGAEPLHLAQDLRESRTWDHAILHDVIWRDPADGSESRLAAL